jgi:hypothetical protein
MAELALKKRMLRQRSEVLRHTLAIQLADTLEPAAGLASRAASTGRWLRRYGGWMAAGMVALLVAKPKALPNLAGRLSWAWQTWLRWQPLLMPVLAPLMAHWRAAMAKAALDREAMSRAAASSDSWDQAKAPASASAQAQRQD